MGDERDPKDVDRDAILARRARFVATAMAGLSIAAGCEGCEPQPCLNIALPQTALPQAPDAAPATTASAAPSASVAQPAAVDAGAPDAAAPVDAGSTDAGMTDAGAARDAGKPIGPPKPKPRPCLMVIAD